MTFACPDAQQFYADYCAPVLDKYRNDDQFIFTTCDGVKLFDVQLAMLNEQDVFCPVVNCDNKVIGFVHKNYPQYLFADTNGAGGDDSNAADIFCYAMRRFVEDEQTTSFLAYSGFRHVYVSDDVSANVE
jgi:hypothetical protein